MMTFFVLFRKLLSFVFGTSDRKHDLTQIAYIVTQNFHFCLHRSILGFQCGSILSPFRQRQLSVMEMRFQLALGGVILPKLAFVFFLEFVFFALELDAIPFIVNGLGVCIVLCLSQKLGCFFHLRFNGFTGGRSGIQIFLLCRYPCFQIGNGTQIVFADIIHKLAHVFEIAYLAVDTPCTGVAFAVIIGDDFRKGGFLRCFQLTVDLTDGSEQFTQHSGDILSHAVDPANPSVHIALIGADALCFHGSDSHTLMDGGNLVDALSLIAAVVDPAV